MVLASNFSPWTELIKLVYENKEVVHNKKSRLSLITGFFTDV